MPLQYLCNLNAKVLANRNIQYTHAATGFTFQMGPATSHTTMMADSGDEEDEDGWMGGEEEVSFVPIKLGAAADVLPGFLQVCVCKFWGGEGEAPRGASDAVCSTMAPAYCFAQQLRLRCCGAMVCCVDWEGSRVARQAICLRKISLGFGCTRHCMMKSIQHCCVFNHLYAGAHKLWRVSTATAGEACDGSACRGI